MARRDRWQDTERGSGGGHNHRGEDCRPRHGVLKMGELSVSNRLPESTWA